MEITIQVKAEDGEERQRPAPAGDTDPGGEVVVVEIPAAGDPFTAVADQGGRP